MAPARSRNSWSPWWRRPRPGAPPETQITADAGYHSHDNLIRLEQEGIEAWLPDTGYRQRDERHAGQEAHKAKPDPLWDRTPQEKKAKQFQVSDFTIDPERRTCICQAGKSLYASGRNCTIKGAPAMKFEGAKTDCGPCALRAQCLRKPDVTATRQVAYFLASRGGQDGPMARMKQKIDSDQGKRMIMRRFATVEPVFGNLRNNKRLDRFTLRGKTKVDGQWKLYCLVHNIEKMAHHG